MTNSSQTQAVEAREAYDKLIEAFNDLNNIIKNHLEPHEKDRYRYNTLGHVEPGLMNEHQWVVGSEVKALEWYVEELEALAEDTDEDDSEQSHDGED